MKLSYKVWADIQRLGWTSAWQVEEDAALKVSVWEGQEEKVWADIQRLGWTSAWQVEKRCPSGKDKRGMDKRAHLPGLGWALLCMYV